MMNSSIGSATLRDPVLDLLGHVDAVVMLLPAEGREAVHARSWAARFSKRMRVVLVTPDRLPVHELKPVIDGRTIRLTLPIVSPPNQHNLLNRALRKLGLVRPLFWLEDPSQAAWFNTSYAAFKVVAQWDRVDQALELSGPHADAILVASLEPGGLELPQ